MNRAAPAPPSCQRFSFGPLRAAWVETGLNRPAVHAPQVPGALTCAAHRGRSRVGRFARHAFGGTMHILRPPFSMDDEVALEFAAARGFGQRCRVPKGRS